MGCFGRLTVKGKQNKEENPSTEIQTRDPKFTDQIPISQDFFLRFPMHPCQTHRIPSVQNGPGPKLKKEICFAEFFGLEFLQIHLIYKGTPSPPAVCSQDNTTKYVRLWLS